MCGWVRTTLRHIAFLMRPFSCRSHCVRISFISTGLLVWATCIPRRFVPIMLWKSLPYLFSHLAGPFCSRGVPIRTDSLYTRKEHWGPENYYAEESRIRDRTYQMLRTKLNDLGEVDNERIRIESREVDCDRSESAVLDPSSLPI